MIFMTASKRSVTLPIVGSNGIQCVLQMALPIIILLSFYVTKLVVSCVTKLSWLVLFILILYIFLSDRVISSFSFFKKNISAILSN